MLAARVNTEEERRIRQAAKAQNISVASLIRSAVLAAVEQV
jgi:predicted HicB family RNase H-like nuclease